MGLITKDTDYAMRALIHFTRNPGRTLSARDVAERLGLSRPFLRKILQRLGMAGVLSSERGKAGGFRLARDARRVRVGDLVELFQDRIDVTHCDSKSGPCANAKTCLVHRRLRSLQADFDREIGRLDIKTLSARRS